MERKKYTIEVISPSIALQSRIALFESTALGPGSGSVSRFCSLLVRVFKRADGGSAEAEALVSKMPPRSRGMPKGKQTSVWLVALFLFHLHTEHMCKEHRLNLSSNHYIQLGIS